ncbi:MAG: GLPGLI family protein [Flavobacterium sp.]|nr:MAG: GLPGLI family protein [Flavobacterium sp.]
MKTLFTIIFTTAITSFVFAQSPDKTLARVRYTFSHIQDTTEKDKPYTENMLLAIGKNASVYTSYDKITQDNELKRKLTEQMKEQAGSGNVSIRIDKTGNKATSQLEYFFFAKENKFVTKERVFNNYLIEETAPTINWKLAKDTASFSGVKCQKATAYFKGRNWIAWYAPELPFQSGPWKLNGLPGLIIEAYDEKKDVVFTFAGIDNVADTPKPVEEELKIPNMGSGTTVVKVGGIDTGSSGLADEIKLPADAIKTTRKEIDKLKEAREKDPQGFMQAQMAASGMNIKLAQGTSFRPTGTSTIKKIEINNPIELPVTK